MEMAKDIPWNKVQIPEGIRIRESSWSTERKIWRRESELYQLLMGLSTLDEELEGIKKDSRVRKRTGF